MSSSKWAKSHVRPKVETHRQRGLGHWRHTPPHKDLRCVSLVAVYLLLPPQNTPITKLSSVDHEPRSHSPSAPSEAVALALYHTPLR